MQTPTPPRGPALHQGRDCSPPKQSKSRGGGKAEESRRRHALHSWVTKPGPEAAASQEAENVGTGRTEVGACHPPSPSQPATCRAGRVMSAAAPSPSCTQLRDFLQNRFSGISDTAAAFCLPAPPAPRRGKRRNKGGHSIIKVCKRTRNGSRWCLVLVKHHNSWVHGTEHPQKRLSQHTGVCSPTSPPTRNTQFHLSNPHKTAPSPGTSLLALPHRKASLVASHSTHVPWPPSLPGFPPDLAFPPGPGCSQPCPWC